MQVRLLFLPYRPMAKAPGRGERRCEPWPYFGIQPSARRGHGDKRRPAFGLAVRPPGRNLLIFSGPRAIDGYSALLHSRPGLLWAMQGGLLFLAALHGVAALQLARRAQRANVARAIPRRLQVATLATRTMRWSGALLAGFIVFHPLHLTLGTVHSTFQAGAVYHNLTTGLRSPGWRRSICSRSPWLRCTCDTDCGRRGAAWAVCHFKEAAAGLDLSAVRGRDLAGLRRRTAGGAGRCFALSGALGFELKEGRKTMSQELHAGVPAGPLPQSGRVVVASWGWSAQPGAGDFMCWSWSSGLAGASAAATLGELGYQVSCFCIQDSPRRAHSVGGAGGINAAKDYCNDGDSCDRLFYDTIRGGATFACARTTSIAWPRLSTRIIDHRVAQGRALRARAMAAGWQPIVRRGAGQPDVLRPRADGTAVSLGAYRALAKEIAAGTVKMFPSVRCWIWWW